MYSSIKIQMGGIDAVGCTLCAGRHPPFLCSKAQIDAKPNWYKIEYKRAKQDGREPDYRWGEAAAYVDADPPNQESQCPVEDPQPQCAAAAMMHGISRAAASSRQGGCPTIAEHQEWKPPVPSQRVIWPNPGYKIEANLLHLNVPESASRPGPLAFFLGHRNTMDSPYIPSYGRGGSQPVDDIVYLDRNASMENLRELQKYSEKLHFEATCCRLWANGILDQIMDEQEKVQTWNAGMTDELIRLRRIQPAWIQQLQTQGGPISTSAVHSCTFHPAAADRIIQCCIYYSSEASTRLQGTHSWHLRHGMHRFQEEWEPIHGVKHGRKAAPVIGIDDAMAEA